MPVLPGPDDPEAPGVHRSADRTQDGHQERAELHRGRDPGGTELSNRTPGRQQQGSIPGQSILDQDPSLETRRRVRIILQLANRPS